MSSETEYRKVQVVVTASGAFGAMLAEDTTPESVIRTVANAMGIDLEGVEDPFVVVTDANFGGHGLLAVGEAIAPKLKENDMLRVVLPLKPQV